MIKIKSTTGGYGNTMTHLYEQNYPLKLGDKTFLDHHILMCGDARTDLEDFIKDENIKLILSDPPFGINRMKGNTKMIDELRPISINKETMKDSYNSDDFPIFEGDEDFTPEPLVKTGLPMILFGGNYYHDLLPRGTRWFVWYKKPNLTLSPKATWSDCELIYTTFSGVKCELLHHSWFGMIRKGERRLEAPKRLHPTQKPVGLLIDLIQRFTKEGDTILDPYAGAGSTLIACAETGRKCLSMEIMPEYCERIIQRYYKYREQTLNKFGKVNTNLVGCEA